MQPQENALLRQLVSSVNSEHVLTVNSMGNTQIIVQIRSGSKPKASRKQYKIKYQSGKQFEQIANFINAYSHRKIKVSNQNFQVTCQKLREVKFSEVILSDDMKYEYILKASAISADKYIIGRELQVGEIEKVYTNLQSSHSSKNKIFDIQFRVGGGQVVEVMSAVGVWLRAGPCSCELEKVVIYYGREALLSLERSKLYGISVCLHKLSSNVVLTLQILELFKKCDTFVSIELLDWQPYNFQPLNYILSHYEHRSKYLLKFGNYLQITEFRLFINTTGMTKQQVAHIFHLMKHPGHYELVCHSSKEYFEEVINFFLFKPLVYFKYFAPLTQIQQLQVAIEAMMEKVELLRKKMEALVKMLKSPEKLEARTIMKVLLSMSKTSRMQDGQ